MAIIADLRSPVVISDLDGVTIMQGRLPVPARAWGFVVTPDELEREEVLGPTSIIPSAVSDPESSFLEPSIGQIWPR